MSAEGLCLGDSAANPGSLKARLNALEQVLEGLNADLAVHKKDVQVFKAEKDTLQSVLLMKSADVKDSLNEELEKLEEEMKGHFVEQKRENCRLQEQIGALKAEKTALKQQLIGLQQRIKELEMQIGAEEAEPCGS